MIRKGRMSDHEYSEIKRQLEEQAFSSNLHFLNDHNGIRKKEISTIIGPKGGGKSSLVRTIQCELIQQHKKVYTILSEESPDFYIAPIFNAFNSITNDSKKTNIFLDNILFESQLDMTKEEKNIQSFIHKLELTISEEEIEVVIFDNFTTSFICSGPFSNQSHAIHEFKRIAIKYNIAFLLVIHTQKGTDIYKNLIDGENVRGDATSVNMGSYNYILTTYFRTNPPRVFLFVDKARYHAKSNKRVYELNYDKNVGLYTTDIRSSYEQMKLVLRDINKREKKFGVNFD